MADTTNDTQIPKIAIRAFMIAITLLTALWSISAGHLMVRASQSAVVIDLVGAIALWFLHQGKKTLGGWLFIGTVWMLYTWMAIATDGMRSNVIMSFIPLVVAAGLLVGYRTGLTVGIVTILMEFGLVVAAQRGFYNNAGSPHTPLAIWLVSTYAISLAMLLQYLSVRALRNSLSQMEGELKERQRIEQSLGHNEALMLQLIKNMPVSVAMFDTEMRYVQASDQWISDYHLQGKNIIGKSHYECSPDIPERWRQIHRRVLAGAVERSDEDYTEDGKEWLQWEARPWYKPEGGIGGMILFAQFITERKRAQEELRESQRRFKAMMENIHMLSVMVNKDGYITYCNDYLLRLSGWPRLEVIGKHWGNLFVPQENRAQWKQRFDALISGKVSTVHPLSAFPTREGDVRQIQWSITVLRSPEGEPIGAAGVGQDITEQIQAEQTLLEKLALQEQLGRIVSALPGVVYTFKMLPDGSMCMPYASPRIREITGVYPEDVKDNLAPALANIHADDLPSLMLSITDALQRQAEWHQQFRVDHPERGLIHVQGRALPMAQPDGTLLWYGYLVDVTDRVTLEVQMRQAQKMEAVGRLCSGIAHDFNNIMGIVIGYSDMVLEDLTPGDKNATRIQKIQSAAMRANALTRQLLAFSQQRVVLPTAVNLNTQVAELAKMLPTLLRDEVECILNLDPSLWDVRADPTQIDQVIMNLSLNARDAMPDGGTLRIETRNVEISPGDVVSDSRLKTGAHALLVVTDTGTGISPEAQEHIFEPFFTTKESGKGTGLGLATVYGIVQQSGGFICVKTQPGKGTTFSIYLPKYVKPTFSENLQEVHA